MGGTMGSRAQLLSCYTGLDSLCAPFLALSFNNEGTCNHIIYHVIMVL